MTTATGDAGQGPDGDPGRHTAAPGAGRGGARDPATGSGGTGPPDASGTTDGGGPAHTTGAADADATGPADGSGPVDGSVRGVPGGAASGTARDTEHWRGVERALLRMRRLVLTGTLVPVTLLTAGVPGALAGPGWALPALLPLGLGVWGWGALARNWRSWRYAERADDLLIAHGVLWREVTVVPYGRMQLVEVTSGPLERRYGLARLQLHTAAATTDATVPGLTPEEAERLRDRLTELGEARSAGL